MVESDDELQPDPAPDGGGRFPPRCHLSINSTEPAEQLARQKSVLIVPGDHFGLDHYLRISLGLPPDYLQAEPDHMHELAIELQR